MLSSCFFRKDDHILCGLNDADLQWIPIQFVDWTTVIYYEDSALLNFRETNQRPWLTEALECDYVSVPQAWCRGYGILKAHSWIRVCDARKFRSIEVSRQGLDISFNETSFPWKYNRDAISLLGESDCTKSKQPSRITLFRSEWQADFFRSYRPLIYFVALGNDKVFEQLRVALLSIDRFGNYSGDLAIVSDREHSAIQIYIPERYRNNYRTIPMKANSFEEMCLCRYRISEWSDLEGYGPILYLDTDVVSDTEIDSILIRIMLENDISVGAEDFSSLDVDNTVGSCLLVADEVKADIRKGFNSGLIGVASPSILREVFPTVIQIMRELPDGKLKAQLTHYDQGIANYVFLKSGYGKERNLTGYVRYSRWGGIFGGDFPKGFVHFWGYSGETKTRMMLEYLTRRSAYPDMDLVPFLNA